MKKQLFSSAISAIIVASMIITGCSVSNTKA